MNRKSALIIEMTTYYTGDVKRINHFMKVYSFAKTIADMEQLDIQKQEIVEIAAIVHDIGIKISEKKYNSGSGKYQQIEGPAIAEELLNKLNFGKDIISRVCYLVGHHHTYQAIDDIDFQILVEADCLVNIHEDVIGKDEVIKMRDNYFKTKTGKALLEKMYMIEK